MTIEEFMKVHNCRLSASGRWLVWDGGEWVVYERVYRARSTWIPCALASRVVHSGYDLDEALTELEGEAD